MSKNKSNPTAAPQRVSLAAPNPHRVEVEQKRAEIEQQPAPEITLQDIYVQQLLIIDQNKQIIDLLTKRRP